MAPGQNGGGGGERYLVLYPEEDSNVETSVPEDFQNNCVIFTILKFTLSNYAAQDFLSLFHIGRRRVLSSLRQPCSLLPCFAYTYTGTLT